MGNICDFNYKISEKKKMESKQLRQNHWVAYCNRRFSKSKFLNLSQNLNNDFEK